MRKDLNEIRMQLVEISEKEATKLFRLAWRMQAHGCDPKEIRKVREEASHLHMNSYPERLVNYFEYAKFEYAFKY